MPEAKQHGEGEEHERDVRARSFWSGTISFGLVSVPVNLFAATRSTPGGLRMLAPDGTPLAREYACPEHGRPVESDEIVRGYPLPAERGAEREFVLVEDEELDALEPQKSREIDLQRFVPRAQIDPILFERGYFLTPAADSSKAYRLLVETMERTGRAGIATFIMRGKEYLIAILADKGLLRAETLRFADEVRSPDDVGLPEPLEVKRARVREVEQEIEALAADELDPDELSDRSAARLLELVEQKRQAGQVVETQAAEAPAPEEPVDIMEVLKRSLAGAGDARYRASRRTREGQAESAGDALSALSKKDLYERAKELDLPGRSQMSKDELVSAIRGAT